jgi:hypothetical protein
MFLNFLRSCFAILLSGVRCQWSIESTMRFVVKKLTTGD